MSTKNILLLENVELFLKDLKDLLTRKTFNIDNDFNIKLKKRDEDPLDPYITQNTLLALDYGRQDVVKTLLSLEKDHYLETIVDNLNPMLPPFFAFVKVINNRDVYIKVKIKKMPSKQSVFCVSFHFARFPILHPFPYE